MDLAEETIWKKIQQKKIETFERYYQEHYKSFFLMAFKYLKDSSQAEEIVNDVFLKIWEDGSKITIETSLKSYLYRSIINRCINMIHKNKKEKLIRVELNSLPEEGYELKLIEETELRVQLYAAIDKLPDQCKRIFEMSRFEGLKQQEIADKLGISIKTVKNHITLALKQLNKSIYPFLLWLIALFLQYFCIYLGPVLLLFVL